MISMVIIARNEEQYLAHVLSDITKQSEKPYEVVVVDDHSTDKTKEVALRFQKKLPLIVLSSDKKGPSAARNKGATAATGETIVFLDADVRIADVHFLKKIKKLMQKHPVIFPKIVIEEATPKEKFAEKIMQITMALGKVIGIPGARGGCMIVKKELFKKVHGFKESLPVAEDLHMAKKLKKAASLCYARDLIVAESPRRYRAWGVGKTLWTWTKAGIATLFQKTPKEYEQVR